jgi:hypothetical protein
MAEKPIGVGEFFTSYPRPKGRGNKSCQLSFPKLILWIQIRMLQSSEIMEKLFQLGFKMLNYPLDLFFIPGVFGKLHSFL